MASGNDEVVIYHNPRCAKSRAALALLEQRNVPLRVVEYLKNPPDREQLRTLLYQLGMRPAELARQGEAIFKENLSGRTSHRRGVARYAFSASDPDGAADRRARPAGGGWAAARKSAGAVVAGAKKWPA